MIGLFIVVALVGIAFLAPLIAPYDPNEVLIGKEEVGPREKPCVHVLGCPEDQPQHIMGTDGNVRDEFSRIIYGARVSLTLGFFTVTIALIVGSSLGALAGYVGGWFDNITMRIMDVILGFPSLLLAIAIVSVLGPGLQNALIAIAIVSIPAYARVTARAGPVHSSESDYVTASKALGASSRQILVRRVVPNAHHSARCSRHPGSGNGNPRSRWPLLPRSGGATSNSRMGDDAGSRNETTCSPPRTWCSSPASRS